MSFSTRAAHLATALLLGTTLACSSAPESDVAATGDRLGCALVADLGTSAPVDSGICDSERMLPHLREGQAEVAWDGERKSCFSWRRLESGLNEVTQVDESLLAVESSERAYESRAQRCSDVKETQRLCRLRATEHVTSCIPRLELDCRRLLSPLVGQATCEGQAPAPAVASRCTAVTVGGIGYPDMAKGPQRIDACTAIDPVRPTVVDCAVLGQTLRLERGYCDRLTYCAEPVLKELYGDPEADGQTYSFPSTGPYRLHVDLSCSTSAALSSNHHPRHFCRALDFNVHENYGNLRRDSRAVPVATIPPEVVAVMEGCGLVWGGRFNGADNVWNGCDPMHFDYDPGCTGSCEPRACDGACRVREGAAGGECVTRDECRCT